MSQISGNVYVKGEKLGSDTDITKVHDTLGSKVYDSLLSFRWFTGCEAASCSESRVKVNILKFLKSSKVHLDIFITRRQDQVLAP